MASGGGGGGGAEAAAVRTSDRLRLRPKMYGRAYLHHYYSPSASIIHRNRNRNRARKRKAGAKGTKTRNRTAASHIADKFLSNKTEDGGDSNLRRSTRKRKAVHLEDYTDSTGCEEEDEDNDIMRPSSFHRLREDDLPLKSNPRRAGLRPRRSKGGGQVVLEDDEEEDEDGEPQQQVGKDEDELRKEEEEEELEEEEEDVEEEEEEEEEEEDVEEEEEEEGRRRYDLRNRADVVRRMSMMDEGKPRRHQVRKSGSGPKRHHHPHHHRMTRAALDDSDDSLLVDEPAAPWVGRRPWLLDASGWGESTSAGGVAAAAAVVHTSSKGGADIQPVQVGEEVSFDDVGGLSEHIEALKEMVFFPLLYPEFFASYHITPPRGVLLCGPPGTGKTLMARALACSASKAGRKVSFYMRKGADVLSKWVGEAERQLKMLFEEAQRNQPSIIFFDEIDGLAPVRSSKQEQIHNSIVSTLLALMDGLDSRGQVVLLGATNRVDAIDGALRRPGRFDREFTFPLPNAPARAHILDIHTRRWRLPPSPDLRHELAAACVGYCGADLKALCTEAAIRAFRQRYPQVYASDDKFLIDADSITVNRAHFLQAMSAITPAAHRGSLVLSRPLPPVVAPCLRPHLLKAMDQISDVFPDLTYRPRLLLCASPASGLDHIAPAILHELEKFPVHSIGLSSLISDPSAKTPEEALVHIFAEARRTTPSVLYLPHFHLWWDTAHDQLKAVLLTLLEELPSDLPILLLGTSSVPLDQLDSDAVSIFSNRSVYQVGDLTEEDRGLFFDHLIQSALSVLLEGMANKSPEPSSSSVPELQKAPTVVSGPKISELKAKVEAEQHALRRLRMCLRDICNRILYDKRFTAFHFPVSDEDAPNYRAIIQNPMDMASLLQRVDSGQYISCSAFVEDIDLIVSNAKAYNGDDYNGSRIVSRAYELRDTVHGMLSQMDPGLVAYCDKIQEEGGPMQLPEELGVSTFPSTPVVQLGTSITRASARVRNVQPEINVDKSYEALKRPKKSVDDEKSQPPESPVPETSVADHNQPETCVCDASEPTDDDVSVQNEVESVKRLLVERSQGFCIPQLERLYTRIIKAIFQAKDTQPTKASVLRILLDYAQDDSNFAL